MIHEQASGIELGFQQTADGGGLVMNGGGSDCC
jgi:hypothetical protein